MTHEEIIIELTRDLYTLRKAYKEEQIKSNRHWKWYKEEEAKVTAIKIELQSIKEITIEPK